MPAKFLTKRVVNLEAVMRTLKPLWRSVHDFNGRDMGNNRVLFRFTDTANMERVLVNGLWSFDKYLILLKRLEDVQSFSEVVFDSCSFWVQIHDLPVRCMTSGVCGRIRKTLGHVEQVEEFNEGRGGGNFMRIRVQLDITQPLCRGRKIRLGGEQDHWVSFKFERLPIFCYWCGQISHDDRDCAIWLNSRGSMTPDQQEYGPWLRGELPRFSRREGQGRGAPPREFSSSETRGEPLPVRSSAVAVQTKTNMASPEITPTPKLVTEKMDFQAKLQEIDRELGLEYGEINESLELLIQGDSQINFQMSKAGVLNVDNKQVGLVNDEPMGEPINRPKVDLGGPQRPNKKLPSSTWKRIARNTNGPTPIAPESSPPKQKRGQSVLIEEEVVRCLKKNKVHGDSSINDDEISAEVAMQPHQKP